MDPLWQEIVLLERSIQGSDIALLFHISISIVPGTSKDLPVSSVNSNYETDENQATLGTSDTQTARVSQSNVAANSNSSNRVYIKLNFRYACNICDTLFPWQKLAEEHLSKIHGLSLLENPEKISHQQYFDCQLCATEFSDRKELISHVIKKHSGAMCKLCSALFLSEESCTVHLLNHKESKICICNICKLTALTYSGMHYHVQIYHKEVGKCTRAHYSVYYVCMFCKELFETEVMREVHEVECKMARQKEFDRVLNLKSA